MAKPLSILSTSILFLYVIIGFLHPITAFTQDLGRHLITGELIFKSHQVFKTNFFSYTHPNFPFVNTHWLSEVVFFIVSRLIGLDGLLLFATIIALLAFSLVFFFALKRSSIIPLVIISLLYIRILFERTELRPEIFSFLFLSLFITILYRYRERFTRLIFILIPLEFLWVNMHIYFFLGLAVIGFFVVDELAAQFFEQGMAEVVKKLLTGPKAKKLRVLVFIFFFSFLITLLNPNGLHGATYPFTVFKNYGYQIEENQNILFLWQYSQKPTIAYFALASILLVTSLFLTIKKTKIIDWLLSFFFIIVGYLASRNMPLLVFATLIPFANSLSILYRKIPLFSEKNITDKSIYIKNIMLIFLIGIVLWKISDVIVVRGAGLGVEPGAKYAADFFITNNIRGPIFNNFDIGSYLDYRLFGKEKVFVDGRPEGYPASFFGSIYGPMQNDMRLFDEVSQKYHFNSIFFAHTDQTPWGINFIKQIVNNKDWKLIYLDDYIMILVKNADMNSSLIKKYEMTKNSLRLNNTSYNNFRSLVRLASLYNKVEWKEEEMLIYQKILLLSPNFCPALYNLTTYYALQNSPLTTIYATRLQNSCR